jgi:GSH-dependent disulfide-bond oxidoreductase
MIDLYTWPTSNGQRAAIALEECGLAYRVHRVDLSKDEQHAPAFLTINPAGVIPAIVDPDGPGGAPLALAQSGAIALYAATKSGRFLPTDPAQRAIALQWLFFACADAASASGALYYLGVRAPEKSEPNLRYLSERLVGILRVADRHLARQDWLAGELSIADFALYPVVAVRRALVDAAGDLPHLVRWADALGARPGVARGMTAAD